ncbi:hypothetical protein OPKNFCMD_0040 [Methylobacterium crusticola]|uniref:EAL domain-containing protein n=1 Tax=Methylobacterium crusticola TaxID=1697972 RepID=A0ABQ4QQM4_9HYPH|nr:EAL domain-containing protein [Methylobacterium crusticola]GJD47334.1 hypothetical protein OPKNFCMD_0040 [Methylobacterium crusticola]
MTERFRPDRDAGPRDPGGAEALGADLGALCRTAAAGLGTAVAYVVLAEDGRHRIAAFAGPADRAGLAGDAFHGAATAADAVVTTACPSAGLVVGAPIRDSSGTRLGALCLADAGPRDLSEAEIRQVRDLAGLAASRIRLDRMERETSAHETRYHLLAQHATDMIVWAAPDGTRRFVSPACRALLGYEPEELVGRPPYELVHPDDVEAAARTAEAFVQGDRDRLVTCQRYRRRDGAFIWAEAIVNRTRGRDGETTGFVALVRDVSDRRLAEDAMREGETRYRALADGLPQIVWVIRGGDGAATYVNRQFRAYFGPSSPEQAGRMVAIHPDDRVRVEAGWEALHRGVAWVPVEARLRRHDGFHRWHRLMIIPMGQGAETSEYIATALDIDDIVVARNQLTETTDLLRLAQEAIGAAIWDWDRRAGVIRHSRESARLLGVLPEAHGGDVVETTSAEMSAHIHPDDAAHMQAEFRRSVATRTTYAVEYRVACPEAEGGYRWLNGFGRLVFDDAQAEVVRVVGLNLDVSGRKAAEQRIAHLARHDPLTDLPNRTLFRERLEQVLTEVRRSGGSAAVLCLDLDRFKLVNDTLGHPAGDALLAVVAARLRAALRAEDVVARLGGDEFAIIEVGAGRPGDTRALCERLIELVGQPIRALGHMMSVGLSIGVARVPEDGLDGDALFKRADLALYRAKADGRNTSRFFEAAMDAAVEERRRLELDLRAALGGGGLEAHYQPVVRIATGAIRGFEALVRWRHPERGLVPPGVFIPLAEETGLIAAIGARILLDACRDAAAWPDPDLIVAVNVSAVQFRQDGLLRSVTSALAETGLPARRLELEITETLLVEDSAAVLATLRALRDLGVRIALDDFGIGYSSLSYLRKFPFDKIKIDRSFVEDFANPSTAAIVRSVVGLGLQLGIAICAEGVETREQLALMEREGCTEAQGYFLSPPVPAAEAAAFAQGARTLRAA